MKKALLILEFILFFVFVPMAIFYDGVDLPVVGILLVFALYCFIILWRDPGFDRGMIVNERVLKIQFRHIMVRAAFAMVFITFIFVLFEGEELFALVLNEPLTWLLIIILYPLLSVVPQEVIYRAFIFHRYSELIVHDRLRVHLGALAFSFVHIIYFNYVAVFLTYGAGYLFGRTYYETRSLLAVSIEHTIYGIFLFTIGLGKYFYRG